MKVLAHELSASVSAERFTREIATAARLQQANIVPVLAAGTSGGVPYYTMPFVTGESLRAQMTTGTPLSMHDRPAPTPRRPVVSPLLAATWRVILVDGGEVRGGRWCGTVAMSLAPGTVTRLAAPERAGA